MPERIVQCHGCFDLLHLGHIRHFQAAKQAGDRLIVTVTPDAYVNKGPGRPVFSEAERIEAIQALACVDEVRSSGHPTAAEAIREIRPAVFAKGLDYTDENLDPNELQAIEDVGAEVMITNTEKFSSTALLQRQAYTPEVEAYLEKLRAKYSAADVLGWLEKARSLKVLVIGDAIRDEYHYVDVLGKSGKDPILAAQFVTKEEFAGGVDAVASHVTACSDYVECAPGPSVTVKRRFIERYPFQKLFEIYDSEPSPLLAQIVDGQPGIPMWPHIDRVDLVIVADYGHGLMEQAVIDLVTKHAKFLAVNTQANAGNHGFNTISKYLRADFISLSERELRLDWRNGTMDIVGMASQESLNRNGSRVLVTRGEKGCLAVFGAHVYEAPALTTHAVDRTGAGDAVFAITACCAAVGMPLDLLTFMASVVGSQAVGIIGNARYIERESLHAAIRTVLE
jgi:rfaE bifunctional protein nucleotidyltransferase chain/domain